MSDYRVIIKTDPPGVADAITHSFNTAAEAMVGWAIVKRSRNALNGRPLIAAQLIRGDAVIDKVDSAETPYAGLCGD